MQTKSCVINGKTFENFDSSRDDLELFEVVDEEKLQEMEAKFKKLREKMSHLKEKWHG
ncbi:hypothetical protein ABID29_001155 [Streptococcus rupicaprae]|uniref:Uncharacterized protein n=1 Tax=Streptococcus rupicaprae TaxID=759619 RepID=A0ABV2FHM5_9STRE